MGVVRGNWLAIVAMLALSLALAASARAGEASGERIALPFNCSMEGARVRLMPSKERIYAILGQRQEQAVMACTDGGKTDCRTMVAHRFTMACGGRRVPWADVVQAIGGRRNSRVWSEAGRLNLAITDAATLPASPVPCEQPGRDAGRQVDGMVGRVETIALRPCAGSRPIETRFTMPAGFAPVAHFGGRILSASAVDARPVVDVARTPPRAVVIAAAAPVTAREASDATRRMLERTIITQPLPDITTALPVPDPASAKAGATAPAEPPVQLAWSATVRPALVEAFAASQPETSALASRDMLVWLLLTVGLVSVGWMAWAQPAALTAHVSRYVLASPRLAALAGALAGHLAKLPFAGLSGVQGAQDATTYPSEGIDAQLVHVEAVVGAVDPQLPLRRVLDEETRRVRQRLAVAKAAGTHTSSRGVADQGRLPAAAYRVLMRDMERIERIAESAKQSIAGATASAAASLKVPSSRAEAYEVLGINDTATEATVKKVVDALRMSWHPDLAHDAADREVRDERIKQINIAMELIAAKRQPS